MSNAIEPKRCSMFEIECVELEEISAFLTDISGISLLKKGPGIWGPRNFQLTYVAPIAPSVEKFFWNLEGKFQIILKHLSPTGEIVTQLYITGAKLVDIEYPPLGYRSPDDIMEIKATISAEKVVLDF